MLVLSCCKEASTHHVHMGQVEVCVQSCSCYGTAKSCRLHCGNSLAHCHWCDALTAKTCTLTPGQLYLAFCTPAECCHPCTHERTRLSPVCRSLTTPTGPLAASGACPALPETPKPPAKASTAPGQVCLAAHLEGRSLRNQACWQVARALATRWLEAWPWARDPQLPRGCRQLLQPGGAAGSAGA